MGRPRKTPIIHQLAKEAVAEQAAKRGTKNIKLRPVRFFELLITNTDYSFESHLFDENGTEYIKKKGGEK